MGKVATLGSEGLGGGWHLAPRALSCPPYPAGEGVPDRLGPLSGLQARVTDRIRQLAIGEHRGFTCRPGAGEPPCPHRAWCLARASRSLRELQ